VNLTAHRVTTDARGKESLVSGDQAKPGEVIEYQARYRNEGTTGVHKLVATLPVPAGLEYVSRTASPSVVQASLDGKTFAPVPLTRKVRLADGREVVREVPVSEYRVLRWTLDTLDGHETEIVSARMRVSPVNTATASSSAR
jgi:uncharacterized repeat protein (TIGR01451 family)